MDSLVILWIFLIGAIVGLLLGLTLVYRAAVSPLHKKIEILSSGKPSEQYMEKYPYDIEYFRYIGNLVDGIQFEEDRIIFVKFKTDQSQLSSRQNKIKKLVEKGKVEWFEFKVR